MLAKLSSTALEIYDVDATDPDGDDIAYVIQANVHDAYLFRVEEDTGKIFTRPGVVLDREVCNLPSSLPDVSLISPHSNYHQPIPHSISWSRLGMDFMMIIQLSTCS